MSEHSDAGLAGGESATLHDIVQERMARNASAQEAATQEAAPVADAAPAEAAPEADLSEDEILARAIAGEGAEGDPETGGADGAEGEEREPETAVNAPHWWTADQKARFAELPADLQAIVLENERSRDSAVGRLKQEAAEARNRAQQEVQVLGQHRQAMDDLLARAQTVFADKWDGIDWQQLAIEDPAAYVANKALYDQEQSELQRVEAARKHAATIEHQTHVRSEAAKLAEIAPDLVDKNHGEKRRQEVGRFLAENGVDAESLRWISAHEMALAYDAMRYRQLRAKALKATKIPAAAPAPAKPVRPAAASGETPSSQRIRDLEARANRTGSVDDVLALRAARRSAQGAA